MLLKRRIHEILEPIHAKDNLSRGVNKFLIILILLNSLAVILESVPGYRMQFGSFFRIFEIISVTVFTVEYLLRVWTCDSDEEFSAPVKGRLRFIFRPMSIIDLLAVLPFFLPLLLVFDLRFARILRVIRILRLLKLGRYFEAIQKLGRVFVAKREELVFTLGIVLLLLVISSSLMYYVENPVQPEVFSSIPAAMWWGVATLTTVGYGDVYPVTPLGKILGAVIAIMGIGMVALPAGIIGSGLMEELHVDSNEKVTCPHCGRDIEE